MRKFFSLILILSFSFINTSCGKKGSIHPPLFKIPQKIETFYVIQRGDRIRLRWVNPAVYTDGSPLEGFGKVEIWLVEEERSLREEGSHFKEEKISEEEFLKKARLLASIQGEELSQYRAEEKEAPIRYQYFFNLDKDFLLKKYVFGMRIKDRKKRTSAFSKFLALKPVVLSLPPQCVKAYVHRDRIEIMWDAPETNFDGSSPPNIKGYNIYRSEKDGSPQLINSELLEDTSYEDKDFVFGSTYSYFVRASGTESPPYFQSDNSETIEVQTKDTFPPDPPQGLVLIKGKDFISLSWDMNREKDLDGYRVWRKEEGGAEFHLLTADPIRENTFTDSEVEKNKKYIYSVTALDKDGNESNKSEPASGIIT
ncbi:MAG: fibronectin type III domain-containing protein [Candidatus Aminicenantales bacterium]